MKKLVLATVLTSIFGIASAAGPYASLTYDEKDKQNSAELHNVYGLNVGEKFSNGFGVELRMEDEKVDKGDGTQKQESLLQSKISYAIDTGTFVTPYVGVAVGQKNKSTIDFPFWVAEVGAKANVIVGTVKYNFRRRTAFDNSTTNAFDTNEQTVGFDFNLTKNDTIGVAYKLERRNDSVSSEYNTKGIYYTRSF